MEENRERLGLFTRKSYGKFDCLEQTVRVGNAFSCDIQGGAVVDGGADDRESERDVDGIVKSQSFQRDMTLIMVHADYAVEFLASLRKECRIRRKGAG